MTTDRWHLMTLQLGQPVPAPPAIPGRQHRVIRWEWRDPACSGADACPLQPAGAVSCTARQAGLRQQVPRHENAMGPSQGGVERVRNEFEIALVNGQLIWS